MPHFLNLSDLSSAELNAILEQASAMKRARAGRPKGALDDGAALSGRMVALIFEKPSTRTRVSFDVGVRQMGGQSMVLSGKDMQLGHGESIADTARVLSRYVDLIMIRTFDEAKLLELAHYASVPVINGLTNQTHPCQIMADIMLFNERHGTIKGKKVVWLGDGNNVFHSFIHAAARFDFELVFTGPAALDPDDRYLEWAKQQGAQVQIIRDPHIAVSGADLVLTDTWASMHDDPQQRQARHNILQPYQVNASLMKATNQHALFMHCLPAHRGEEVTDEIMDGTQSVVFDEAENRLHAQKAIMRWCLGV